GILEGTGAIKANGGNSADYRAGGPGGGRIALYYTSKTYSGTITVNGGSGSAAGQVGTIYYKDLGAMVLRDTTTNSFTHTNARVVNVSIGLLTTDHLQYMLSENSDLTGASYVDITARPTQTTTFTLTETDGLKTVYGRLLKSDTTTVDLSATITLDTTAPSAASTFTLEQLTGSLANRIKLTWLNPSNSDLDTAVIVFKTTGAPTSVTDGTEIYNASAAPGASGTYTHLGLTYYTTYYYAVFMKDLAGNYSAAKTGYLKLMPPGPYFAIAVDSTNKVAGAAFNITITAKDGTGATLTTYSDSVELSAVYISPSSGVTALTTVTTGVF
ncbi:MAG: hypothetical protein COS29_02160, partial [Candidatus Omnitrophica bacterium CG02_land_8_20_14_3_00__42_8]